MTLSRELLAILACPKCKGEGKVVSGLFSNQCPACKGKKVCPTCDGKGIR